MKLSKGKLCLAIAGIFALALVSMYTFLYMPAIASLYEKLYDQIGAVNYFIAGSSLVALVVMLLVPALQKLFGKKRLLLAGAVMIACGGTIGLFCRNIIGYCIATTVVQAGYGVTGTMALSVLMDIVVEKQIGLFNGLYQVVVAAGGAILAILGGILTVRSWEAPIHAAWVLTIVLGILAFVLLLVSVPANVGALEQAASEDSSAGNRKTPWKSILLAFVIFFLLGTAYTYVNSLFSVYLEENSLGDAAFAGTLQSLGTIGSAVMCFLFVFAYQKAGKKIILFPLTALLVFLILLTAAPGKALCVAASSLMGASFGCATTYFYTICPDIAPYHMTTAVAAIGIALNLPYAVYSYLYTFLAQAFGSMTRSLLPMAVILAADLLLTAVFLRSLHRADG